MKSLTVRRTLFTALLCAASAAAGWWWRDQSAPGAPPRKTVPALAATPASPASAPNPSPSATNPAPPPNQTAAQRFDAALRHPDRIQRMTLFLAALAEATPENFRTFEEVWNAFRAEGKSFTMFEPYINFRAGELRGTEVLANRTGRPVDYRSLGAINDFIAGAMKKDPAAVRQWYDSLTDEKFREQLFGSYVSALAQNDPAAALDVLSKINPQFQQRSASAIVSAFKQTNGHAGVLDGFRSVAANPAHADAPWLPLLFTEAVQQTSDTSRTQFAAKLMEEHAGKPYADPALAAQIAQKFASWQPAAAFEWSTRMDTKIPSPEAHQNLLTTAIAAVSDNVLRPAADWCLKLPAGSQRTAALTAMAARAALTDAALASELQQAAGTPPP